MFKTFLSLFLFYYILNAAEISDYIDTKKCDQIIDKQLYQICYSYKNKGAFSGWVKLEGNLVGKGEIKKRPKFYSESNLPVKYRSNNKDYTGFGDNWNRGHFIVADADFDYSLNALNKAYTMANIIPMSALVNQKTWTKVERYGRMLALKLGYINSISIAKYNGLEKVGNRVSIPTDLYRIYFNNEAKFERCFYYKNELDIDYKNDKLKDHEIDCDRIRIK